MTFQSNIGVMDDDFEEDLEEERAKDEIYVVVVFKIPIPRAKSGPPEIAPPPMKDRQGNEVARIAEAGHSAAGPVFECNTLGLFLFVSFVFSSPHSLTVCSQFQRLPPCHVPSASSYANKSLHASDCLWIG